MNFKTPLAVEGLINSHVHEGLLVPLVYPLINFLIFHHLLEYRTLLPVSYSHAACKKSKSDKTRVSCLLKGWCLFRCYIY